MDIHQVALAVFAQLAPQGGGNEVPKVRAAYKYAETFMQAMEEYKKANPSVAHVEPFKA